MVVGPQLFEESWRRIHGDSQQRSFKLLERVCSRDHLRVEPAIRAVDGAFTERRDHARFDHTRLAAAARPDDGNEAVLSHHAYDLVGEGLPAEKVFGVGLLECPKTLVRVAGLDDGRRRLGRSADQCFDGGNQRSNVLVTVGRIERRRLRDHTIEIRRHARRHLRNGGHGLGKLLLQQLGWRGVSERVVARHHFVEDHSQAVDVRQSAHGFSAELFRR